MAELAGIVVNGGVSVSGLNGLIKAGCVFEHFAFIGGSVVQRLSRHYEAVSRGCVVAERVVKAVHQSHHRQVLQTSLAS